MSLGLIYWILMLLQLVFGVWVGWGNQRLMGGTVMLFILLLLLGWKVFGSPVQP